MIDQALLRVMNERGQNVTPGSTVTSFRGEEATYYGVTRFGRTGTPKVSVGWPDEAGTMEYNANVFRLTVIELDTAEVHL